MGGGSRIWMNGTITVFCAPLPHLVSLCMGVILRHRKDILYVCGMRSEILHRINYHARGISIWRVNDLPELFEVLERSCHATIIFENSPSIYRDEQESAGYIGRALRELAPDAAKYVLTSEWDEAMDGIEIYAEQVRVYGRQEIGEKYKAVRAMHSAEQKTLSEAWGQ